jgi:GNAT superfamily N-acetyltransferase
MTSEMTPAATDLDAVTQEQAQRWQALDALLPFPRRLEPSDGDALLRVDGASAAGIARCHRPDPDSLEACWGALRQHRLAAGRVGGDPSVSMHALLERWRSHLLSLPASQSDDRDSSAIISWPSRDTGVTQALLDHGLSARSVLAARPAGRAMSDVAPAAETTGRPLSDGDVDDAVALWLAEVRWDAQFGGVVERPAAADRIREEVLSLLEQEQPWAWIAVRDTDVVGLVVVSRPERAQWVAPVVAASPVAYLNCMSVRPGRRGQGIGTRLAAHVHDALDRAGISVTLLHYAALNPLSAPFWHRCGYRPLWTAWEVRPHTAIR